MTDDQITIRDSRGAALVLERGDDGRPFAWIAPPGGNDGTSVGLDANAVAQLAAFLGLPTTPAVDSHGDEVWLTHDGYVEWLPQSDRPGPQGWRRLYVEAATDGGT